MKIYHSYVLDYGCHLKSKLFFNAILSVAPTLGSVHCKQNSQSGYLRLELPFCWRPQCSGLREITPDAMYLNECVLLWPAHCGGPMAMAFDC